MGLTGLCKLDVHCDALESWLLMIVLILSRKSLLISQVSKADVSAENLPKAYPNAN